MTTDTSALTAIGNDLGFHNLFSRQIEALGHEGDLLVALSTSGESENILRALNAAKAKRITTVLFSGKDGGKAVDIADYALIIPSFSTARIQEAHITFGHIMCSVIESELGVFEK